MGSNLKYSAANSSRITKRTINTSPVKQAQKDLKKYLPSQTKYLQNLKNKKTLSPSPQISQAKQDEVPLTVQDYNVQLDYQLSKNDDILIAIDTILGNQWSESTTLHSRFHTRQEVQNSRNNEDLLFLLPGLSMKVKADIIKYRTSQLPHGLITMNQLYSIYEHQGNTFVDRNLEMRIREGKLRKFIITNASPIILRSPQKFQHGKVTYGYENVEVIVKSENYLNRIQNEIQRLKKEINLQESLANEKANKEYLCECLQKFLKFVTDRPTALFIDNNQGMDNQELSKLVSLGYITLTSNHLNEIESHQYSISYPNCGSYLKLINAGRSWLVKTLSKCKYKELLEEHIFNKWEGLNTSFNGTSKMTNFRSPFYGYDLYWILADGLGAGVIEVFNTPVGRGWRLTGKV